MQHSKTFGKVVMSKEWPKVKLGALLRRVERFEPRDNLTEYPFAGTYSFARGIFVGERKFGSTFGLPKVQRIRAGDFVYCKIMAWEGAFGIVPKEADNCVMSGAFVVYEPNRELIDPNFLDYFFKVPTHWQTIGSQSSGTNVRRQSLHPTQFEKAEVPLPQLTEQRRVVARIDALAAQVREAKLLRQKAIEETEALGVSWLNSIFKRCPKDWYSRLEDVAEIIGGGSLPEISLVTQTANDVLLVKVSDMNRTGNEVFLQESAVGLPKDSPLLRGFRILPVNSIVFPKRGGAIATNKKRLLKRPAVLDPNTMGVFSKNEDLVTPEFLFSWFKSVNLASMQGGTSVPQINKGDLAPLEIPIPVLREQRQIVSELEELQAEVDALKRLQAKTAVELDALLPSILDRAFNGGL
jgi:type I restriction enzyme S subunit